MRMFLRPHKTEAKEPLFCDRTSNVQCNPANTLYNKIMYNYAQFNEIKNFPKSRDYDQVELCIFLITNYDLWLNGTLFPYSDGAGTFKMQKIGKEDLFMKTPQNFEKNDENTPTLKMQSRSRILKF